jgi:acyl dehydratase
MEQFPPLLLRAFGERWFETGSLSTYFRNATIDREPARAFAEIPTDGSDEQVRVWMEKDDGTPVLEGTASVGSPAAPSMLRRKLAEPREPGELRILRALVPGAEIAAVPTRLSHAVADARQRVVTEPLDWYAGASPWGGPIANPGLVVHAMVAVQAEMHLRPGAVGLYGAIEVRHIEGPMFIDRDYFVSAKILAVGQTPKTEYFWYESLLSDTRDGKRVASMIMMLRFMKASSKLWQGG